MPAHEPPEELRSIEQALESWASENPGRRYLLVTAEDNPPFPMCAASLAVKDGGKGLAEPLARLMLRHPGVRLQFETAVAFARLLDRSPS